MFSALVELYPTPAKPILTPLEDLRVSLFIREYPWYLSSMFRSNCLRFIDLGGVFDPESLLFIIARFC